MTQRKVAGQGFPSEEEVSAMGSPVLIRGSKSKPVILALDLSTSCVGWAVGSENEIISYGKFVFTSDREMGEKLAVFAQYLNVLLQYARPVRLLVERPMSRRGQVTALHNQLLGVVRLVVYRVAEFELLDSHLVSPITIKRKLGVPKGQNHDHNKQIMVNYVNKTLGLNLRFQPNSKLQSDDDAADAIAILLASFK